MYVLNREEDEGYLIDNPLENNQDIVYLQSLTALGL
jgi:hypothetical protein